MKRFTDTHEWVSVQDGIGTVGITEYGAKEVGETVYVQLPKIGAHVKAGQEVVVLESTKAAIDITSPVSGEILSVNSAVQQDPTIITQSPEKEGWLFTIRLSDENELKANNL
jgi:glycine cleavage system H protein